MLSHSTRRLLPQLLWMKCLIITLASAAVWLAAAWFAVPLPYPALLAALCLAGVTLALWWWRSHYPWPLSHREIAAMLLCDLALLGFLIHSAGGSSNPFTSSLLLPIALAAALLPKQLSGAVLLVGIGIYGLWIWQDYSHVQEAVRHPGHHAGHAQGDAESSASYFSLHIVGMWLNFMASAVLIWGCVAAIAEMLQKREQALRQARETMLQNEQWVGLAHLTANTAHALGTPLSAMSLLLEDAQSLDSDATQMLRDQLASARGHLQQLKQAQQSPQVPAETISLSQLHSHLERHYQLVLPRVKLQLPAPPATLANLQLSGDYSLPLALMNLIDNALEAAATAVSVSWQPAPGQQLLMEIQDDGSGISPQVLENLGQPFVSSKGSGLGLGVFLSHATLERLGGEVRLGSGPAGGTLAQIRLPLQAASPTPQGR